MGWNDRDKRIAIFNDTEELCKSNSLLKAAIQKSIAGQKLISEETRQEEFACKNTEKNAENLTEESAKKVTASSKHESIGSSEAQIVVSLKRSFEAALAYGKQRVCVLNFASATNPGGGVTKGSSAQEECLCRCSTLYPCINEPVVRAGFHYRHRNMLVNGEMDALYNDDCIYTPEVVVFKTDTAFPQILPEDEWYMVDIITCAAPNLRAKPGNYMNPGAGSSAVKIKDPDLKTLHTKRANRILDIAKANGAEVVILGAFGCGAFCNPPEIVADGILEAVKAHRQDFQTIEFAVYCPPGKTENYDVFRERFSKV